MPVDERTFSAEIAGWVTEYLGDNPRLPFARAAVEEHVYGTTQRHDFRLYSRHPEEPVLTGEIKMPDSLQGRHPLNGDLVEDALQKAFRAGVRYCFTWNVRQKVLVYSLDRLTRSVTELNALMEELAANGLEIISITQPTTEITDL